MTCIKIWGYIKTKDGVKRIQGHFGNWRGCNPVFYTSIGIFHNGRKVLEFCFGAKDVKNLKTVTIYESVG